MARVVVLKGSAISPLPKEGVAESTITPGELVERDATDGDIQPHGTAGGTAPALFADINPEIGNGLDDDYVAGQQMRLAFFRQGDEVNALLAASAAAIVINDLLESAGDGTLRKHTPQAVDEGGTATFNVVVGAVVARALEAVDNSGGGTEVRIKAEVV